MTPVLIASLLDPAFWAIIWFTVRCAYRLPKWSWLRLPVALLSLGSLAGVVIAQAHLWQGLAPPHADRKIFDDVLFPEIIPGLVLLFWRIGHEERSKKQREASAASTGK